jgi:hypothetical protein
MIVVQLSLGAAVGVILALNMDRYGISLSNPDTRWTAIGIISAFCCIWIIGTTLIFG